MSRLLVRIAEPFVIVAAVMWRQRADVLELLGAVCLIAAAVTVSAALAWTATGVALLVKAVSIDRGGSA